MSYTDRNHKSRVTIIFVFSIKSLDMNKKEVEMLLPFDMENRFDTQSHSLVSTQTRF